MATSLISLTKYDVLRSLSVARTAGQIAQLLGHKGASDVLTHLRELEELGRVEKLEDARGAWAAVWKLTATNGD